MFCPGEKVSCCVRSTDPKIPVPMVPFLAVPVVENQNQDQDPITITADATTSDETKSDEINLDSAF